MNTLAIDYTNEAIHPDGRDLRFLNRLAAIVMVFALLVLCAKPALACVPVATVNFLGDASAAAAAAYASTLAGIAAAQASADALLEAAIAAVEFPPVSAALFAAAAAAEATAAALEADAPAQARAAALALAAYVAAEADECCQ